MTNPQVFNFLDIDFIGELRSSTRMTVIFRD